MKLVVIRHAQSEDNDKDILGGISECSLTKTGISQAEQAAEQLKNSYTFDHIFSSPRTRCRQTAEIIKTILEFKKDIQLDNRIAERDFGTFTGKSRNELDFTYIDTLPQDNSERVETLQSLEKRVQNFLDDIQSRCKNKTVLVVSHSNPLRFVSAIIENLNFQQALTTHSLKNAQFRQYDLNNHETSS